MMYLLRLPQRERLRNKKARLYFKAGELGLYLGFEVSERDCGERKDGLRHAATPKNLVE